MAVKGYRYYLGIHMGICRGPVDGLVEIWVGEKKAWPLPYTVQVGGGQTYATVDGDGTGGNLSVEGTYTEPIYEVVDEPPPQTTSGTITINAPMLFGGDEGEGGIVGDCDVMMGEDTQAVNTRLAAMLGGLVSAFRGMFTLFFDGQVSAMNPYPSPWKVRVRRALMGWDGDVFYPATAKILLDVIVPTDPTPGLPTQDTGLRSRVFQVNFSDPRPLSVVVPFGSITVLLVRVTPAGGGGDGPIETDLTQTSAGSTDPGWYVAASDATTTTIAFTGTDPDPGPDTVFFLGGYQYFNVTIQFLVDVPLPNDDTINVVHSINAMNAAHIIYECITNRDWGRGLPATAVDLTSFTEVADALHTEHFGLCIPWMRQDTIDAFVQRVLDHINAVLYQHRTTGLLTLKLIRDDYDPAALTNYTMSTGLLEIQEDDSSTAQTLINEIIVKYVDALTGEDAEVRVQNIGLMQAQGAINSKTVDYPGLPTAKLASRVGQRDLKVHGTPLRRFKLVFDRRGWQITPGSVFKITDTPRGLDGVILRAGGIEDATDGRITITCVQDVFGLPANAFVTPASGAPKPYTAPVATVSSVIQETSYFDLLRILRDSISDITETETRVHLFSIQRTDRALFYKMYTGIVGSAFSDKGAGQWTPAGTLAAPLRTMEYAATVTSVTLPDSITTGTAAWIGNEMVQIFSWDSATGAMTIMRGCADSIPQPHDANEVLWLWESMAGDAGIDPTDYTPGDLVGGKVLTVIGGETLHESEAELLTTMTIGRHYRPYPPAKVLVNGVSFGEYDNYSWLPPSGDIAITWVHRNRVTQADVVVHHNADSITPEVGTTYTVWVINRDTGVTVRETTGITGTSWTYLEADWVTDGSPQNVTFALFSVRDGVASAQRYMIPVIMSETAPVIAPPSSEGKPKVAALDYSNDTSTTRKDLLAKFPLTVFGFSRTNLGTTKSTFMDDIRAIRADAIFAQYTCLNELKDPVTSSEDKYPRWLNVENNDWWARKADGSKTAWTSDFGNKEVNITSYVAPDGAGKRYPQTTADVDYTYYHNVAGLRFDMVFMDNFWAQPRVDADYTLTGVNTARTNTTLRQKWQEAYVAYIAAIQALIPGIMVIGNVDGDTYGNSLSPPLYQNLIEGAFFEGAIGKSYSPTAITGTNSLMDRYHKLLVRTKAPHYVLLNAYGSATDYQKARYALAMAMMDDGYLCYVQETPDLEPCWFDEFDQIIGEPEESYRTAAWSDGVWRRLYTGGMVLANPTTSAKTVTIAAGYKSFLGTQDPAVNDGAAKTSITLAAKDGILLLKV